MHMARVAAWHVTHPSEGSTRMQARGGTGTTGITFDGCTNCTARSLTIYTSGGFAIYTAFGYSNTFE